MAEHTQMSSPATPRGFPINGLAAAAVASSRRTLAATHLPRRPAYVPDRIDDPKYVRLFDETLCDMEQSPGAAMTSADILFIARKLALLGVDIIAAGSPAFSPEAFDIVRSIATEIGNKPVGEGGHVPVICGLARCSKEEINRVWDAVKPAQLPRINMLFSTSEIHKDWMTPDQLAAMAGKMVAYARGLGCHDVQFSVEAGRSDKESLYRILEEVIKAGATTINIVDTAVHTLPPVFGKLLGDIKANIPGIENVIISTQCQNCRGLTTANTIAGAIAGARQLQVAISGNGERARNASVEEVVEAIECNSRKYLGGLYTSTNSKRINTTKKMIQEYIGISIQPHIHKVDSSSTMKDSDVKIKAFLSFTNALVCTLSLFYGALCVYSNSYPGSAKALVSYDETWVKVISIANVALWSESLVMIPFASRFKDGESIDNVGFSIFLLVLYLWIILSPIAWCATLCAFLKVPFWEAVLPLGVVLLFFVVLPLIVYVERQRPTIIKLGKNLREKLKNCYVRLPPLPGFFKQVVCFSLEACTRKVVNPVSTVITYTWFGSTHLLRLRRRESTGDFPCSISTGSTAPGHWDCYIYHHDHVDAADSDRRCRAAGDGFRRARAPSRS